MEDSRFKNGDGSVGQIDVTAFPVSVMMAMSARGQGRAGEKMGIEVRRLEEQLLQMSNEEAPGQEFCQAVAELGRRGRLGELRGILPSVVFKELGERYKEDPKRFVEGWRTLAQEMRKGFIEHARHRLTSLTRLQQVDSGNAKPEWQEIQRALDSQQNDLLRAAFAMEMIELIEPAVGRAAMLRECMVSIQCSDEVDRYLDEATRCYFFGLFTACAVMCRSVVEEAIKQKLPEHLAKMVRSRYRNAATLGNLIHEINNNLHMIGVDPGFPRVANAVNDLGKRAVHQGLVSEEEARQGLQDARKALQLLLSR